MRAMHEALELSTEQKRSTDDGIQIKLELPVPPKKLCLSNMNHKNKKRKYLLYSPKCSLGIATKDRTRCESKDHRTHGLIYVIRYSEWQGIIKFPHQEVIRVFVRGMVCLIEHK
jgi:hypothetical protein